MSVSRKFLSRYQGGAVKQNIYTVGAAAAAVLALMAVVKVMAWVTRSLIAVLAIFVAATYVSMRMRGGHRFTSAARTA